MGLGERLGPVAPPRIGCAVCRWYDQLDEPDRADFDAWIANGGNLSQLWRACSATVDADGTPIENPLQVQRPWFAHCVNEHHRGGARVAS
jgi:hypothetical protein